jgi:hypothetical protein
MSVLRYVAPSLSTVFGLYCVIWGLVASSYPTSQRVGGAFPAAGLCVRPRYPPP